MKKCTSIIRRICLIITRDISPRQMNLKPAIIDGAVLRDTNLCRIADFRHFCAGQIVRIILGPILFCLLYAPLMGADSIQAETSIAHHAPLLPWTDDLHQTLTTAKAESLPIYLYFTGSSWCIWCKKMDREIHNTDEFRQKTVGKCLFVRIELPAGGQPSEETQQLLEKYHVSSVPTAILLSPNGEEITRFRYQQIAPADYADLILKASSKKQ